LYRVTTYYSLHGPVSFVELPDAAYGEWIIYDNSVPKYHVNVFDNNADSNVQLQVLIKNKNETIESVIDKINTNQNTQLSLGSKPVIEIVQSSELVDLDLKPLPEHWIKNIL